MKSKAIWGKKKSLPAIQEESEVDSDTETCVPPSFQKELSHHIDDDSDSGVASLPDVSLTPNSSHSQYKQNSLHYASWSQKSPANHNQTALDETIAHSFQRFHSLTMILIFTICGILGVMILFTVLAEQFSTFQSGHGSSSSNFGHSRLSNFQGKPPLEIKNSIPPFYADEETHSQNPEQSTLQLHEFALFILPAALCNLYFIYLKAHSLFSQLTLPVLPERNSQENKASQPQRKIYHRPRKSAKQMARKPRLLRQKPRKVEAGIKPASVQNSPQSVPFSALLFLCTISALSRLDQSVFCLIICCILALGLAVGSKCGSSCFMKRAESVLSLLSSGSVVIMILSQIL